jgi:hypothetical protein
MPYGYPANSQVGLSRAGKTRNPWAVWGLGLLTLGIYSLVWYYKINREARDFDSRINVQPGVAVLAITLGGVLFIPPIVSWVKTGSRIGTAEQLAGLRGRTSGLVGLLLMFVFGFGVVYYQAHLNKVWAAFGTPAAGTTLAR